ncbi:MAG: hypothetical protein C4617_00640 [Candidatus Liberibacter europaeus]|uniref:Peptidoglycan-binding protein n=1 Tax=Candidatus Liberibacter europaeus TaxID=744859 RepID=A0A2T4VYV3_9HYPH|nr:MAG: hypothetical protein C4617_00640 [Candidatus Liberibacter europaeus]
MSGLQQKNLRSGYDAFGVNASGVTDIQRIDKLIKQIRGKNLNRDQIDKINCLLSSLKKIFDGKLQKNNSTLDLSSNPNTKSKQNSEPEISHDKLPNQVEYSAESNKVSNSHDKSEPKLYRKNLEKHTDLDIFHHDITNLADNVSELCKIVSQSGIQDSHAYLEQILSKMDALAKEYSPRNLESNLQSVTKYFKELDLKNLHNKINLFSCQMNAIKLNFDKKASILNGLDIDEKLLSILNNTHSLLSLLQSLSDRISPKKIYSVDVKLSEIKRDVSNNERVIESFAHNFNKKLEDGLETIDKQIKNIHKEVVSKKKTTENNLESLELLNKRLQILEEQPSSAKFGEFLAEISHKVNSLIHNSSNQVISDKLDSVMMNMDNIIKPSQFDLSNSFKKLESNIKDITLQLKGKHNSAENNALLQNLETNISSMKEIIVDQVNRNKLSKTSEHHIVNLDDYIEQTAQKTAQLMLNSLGKSQDMEKAFKNNILECFEDLQKIQAEQTIKNFTTLYDIMAKISQKLDKSIEKSANLSSDDNKNRQKLGVNKQKLYNQNEKSSLLSSNNLLNVKSAQLDDITKEHDSSIKDKKLCEIDEDLPSNIQQILDRVSSIQNGIWEDYNTIPSYISAARRAASASVMGNDTIQKGNINNSKKQKWSFASYFSSKKLLISTTIIATLIVSYLLLSPSVVKKYFL